MTSKVTISIIAAASLAFSWSARALAYRPFDGTDANVAEPHEVELEVGPMGYERQGSTHFLVAPALVLNYGLHRGFEAVLEGRQRWPIHSSQPSELEDVALSLKSMLRSGSLQGGHGTSVALETGVLLPGSERRFGAHIASILSWQWPALVLHLNLGNDLLTSLHYTANSSAIVEGPFGWPVRPVAELLVARDFGQGALTHGLTRSALVGAIATWSDAWVFDVAYRHAIADGQREDEVRLGFTWSFAVQ
ncbi:MAG TPA: hypothetical protein VER11_09565 [Polyangiaceae bacterium]|nr:hypothetical protein [Polyangiaceae bacterium]